MVGTPVPRTIPGGFHVMAKPTGARCNLDCQYCFFLSKSRLYPESRLKMSPHVHEAYLRQLFEAHDNDAEVEVSFQGGEPTLMGLEFFRRTFDLQQRWRRRGQRVVTTLQTNGTLLTDDWGRFLREHDILVGVSIDGPRAIHDAYRVDRAGRPSYGRVRQGLDVLRRHGVPWNALVTVNAANADHGREVYTFLRDDLGVEFIQLIPVVERVTPDLLALTREGWGARADQKPVYRQTGDQVTERSVGAEQYGRFLVEVFDEWMCRDIGTVFVNVFDTALAHWMGMDQVGMCVHARTCGSALALEHNGDLYSCDHFVEEGYRLGNLVEGATLADLVTSERQTEFGLAKLETLPAYCRRCEVRFACNGGCPKDRFLTTPEGEAGLHYLCAGYQRFFRHVDPPMRMMADLARRGIDVSQARARLLRWRNKATDGTGPGGTNPKERRDG